MRKRTIARKIISLILVFCMVFTSLPLSAFAAEAEANRAVSEQVALYMLELGLVDEQGDLIYDNSFTVEDGTKLANLDELLDWLLDCPDDEVDTLITVDATGKTATAEWIITAINIETQMELLTNGLNSLASGAVKSARTSGSSVVTDEQLTAHELDVGFFTIASTPTDDELRIQVGLKDKDRNDITAPNDIKVEVGAFCDFMVLTPDRDQRITVEGTNELYPNRFYTFTLPKGQQYLEFTLDLNFMRESLNDDTCDFSGAYYKRGLFGGAVPVLLQARIASGANEDGANCIYKQDAFSLAPKAERSDAVVLLDGTQTGSDNAKVQFEAAQSDGTPFYVKVDASEATEVTFNGKSYYKIPVPELYGNLTGTETSKTCSITNALTDIYYQGGWDPESSPILQVEGAAIIADVKKSGTAFSGTMPKFYAGTYDSGLLSAMDSVDGYGIFSSSSNLTDDDKAKLQKVAAICNGSETYADSGNMKTLYNNMVDGNKRFVVWTKSLLPTYKTVYDTVKPKELYIAKDWITDTNGNSKDVKPEYFCLWGNLKVKDTTAPTVAGSYVVNETSASGTTYRAGDIIPITVNFTEAMRGACQLIYQKGNSVGYLTSEMTGDSQLGAYYGGVYGSVQPSSSDNLGNPDISRQRTFYYKVQPGDEGISILGVKGNGMTDVAGNALQTSTGLDYLQFDEAITLGNVRALSVKDGIDSITATYPLDDDPLKAKVTVATKTDAMYKTVYANYGKDGSKFKLVVDWDRTTPLADCTLYDVTIGDLNGSYIFTSELDLSKDDQGKKRTVELVYQDADDNYSLYYGAYGQFTQQALTLADENSYTVSVSGEWPSGVAGVVYADDASAPSFGYAENAGASYTYKGKDTLSWQTDAPDVIGLVETGATCTVVAKKAGTANIYLQSNNAGKLDASVASNKIAIEVKDGASPSLMIPNNASKLTVRSGEKLQIPFYSNLGKYDAFEGDGKMTATLYKGADTTGTLLGTYLLERTATMLEIPAGVLGDVSVGGVPAYTVQITANAKQDDNSRKDLQTFAYIVVNSQPAVVTMTGLEETMFADNESKTIKWSIANFESGDLEKRGFEFVIEKNGEVFNNSKITTPTANGEYLFAPDKVASGQLKDTYVVMLKAKNSTDPSWSIASATLTVYDADALKMMVGGEAKKTLTLQTKVAQTETTNAPTVTPYGGTATSGLADANAIAKLRAELTLMDTVSVNYQDYSNWSLLYDTFSWKAENVTGQGAGAEAAAEDVQQVVSINYRQSNYYQPIENFSYAYYLPETVFMLCGLQDGTAKVTATHKSVSGLSAELTVNVNRLKDKLYLFQFSPAVETTLSYTDGLGNKRVVTSNSDGSLALWEPNGIGYYDADGNLLDGELRLSCMVGNDDYRSTVDVRSLRSGEGNGIERELYPLNAIELTRGAMAQFTLLTPDGNPLANTAVTLRGGVYRNPDLVTNRDDAYCADAKFATEQGKPADKPGTENITYKTDASGVVTLYMDTSQFISKVETGAAAISVNFRFIFELQAPGYNPEIVICESGQTYKDLIRTGNNLLTLTKADGQKPLVVVQTVDYYTGRNIDVREHTGVVGPSPDYTELELATQLMLWGVDGVTTDDTAYTLNVRTQESAAKLAGQTHFNAKQVSYPFSSIPLVENLTVINKNTFAQLDDSKRIPLELALFDGTGALSRTVTLPFGLVDVTSVQPLSTDTSLVALMTSIALFGEYNYTVDDDGTTKSTKKDGSTGDTLNGAAEMLIDSMRALEDYGAKRGLTRTILMPTADPTIFSAYVWMGYDNTEMADLRYNDQGVYKEMTHIFQSEDQMCGTFFGKYTMSDFRAMSDGTYDWTDDKNDFLNKLRFGDGKTMQGWMSTEVYYNFDKAKWQIVATGGGFTWGKQIELGGRPKQRFKPFPYNYSIKVRGGIMVSLDMAVRYAEQLGEKWNDETARAVNDYLTTIRINAYLEGYAGLGIDKGLVATVGVFGNVELNNENRILNRSYLKDESRRKLKGSYVQLDGEIGVREKFGIGPLTVEWTWFSYKLGDQWRFKKWKEIDEYWQNASSGFSSEIINYDTQSLQADYGDQMAIAAGTSGVRVQSRDYLREGDREWLGGSSVATMSLDENNKLDKVQTNAYPYSRPLVSDDGSILVYLSDKDSTDVQNVEVRYSLANQTAGMMYDEGKRIADPTDFAGYGDSALDFDGDADHAGAVWLREAATLNLKADATVDASQQLTLVNGLEVVASIWDGENWATTRLTDNGTQEMSPIIAVNDDGDAIVAWREVQTNWQLGDEGVLDSMDFSDSRILYRLYNNSNGTWSDTYTLYNGTSGAVKGMSVEMIDDTAVVAMALDTGVTDKEAENGESASEIYYAVVDTKAADVEADTRTIRATTNDYLDEDPQLATVEGTDADYFVLGWHSLQTESSVEQNDVGLRVLDMKGTPKSLLPEALSNMVSTSSFGGQFTFVKGAAALDELSLLWNDVKAGGDNNDVIRAIKFGQYDEAYAASAPIEVAKLDANNSLTHMDAYATANDGNAVYAMLQVTEYSDETQNVTVYVEDENGSQTETTVSVPKESSRLMSATDWYKDAVAVIATNVDYDTLNTNAQVPVTFTVQNQGLHAITGLTLTVGGVTQTLSDLNLLPGQSKVVPLVIATGNAIEDMDYTLTATFDYAGIKTDTGTLYLDYPDVGISGLQVISEQDGQRTFIATMYNQAAASLDVTNRRVVLGVYTDPSCTTAIDGKYFGGTADKAYEIAIDKSADLQTIDADNFAQKLKFDIAQYIEDAGQTEIPEQGVMLFVRARVEQYIDGNWVELPEADTMNNQKNITFDSLLTRSNNEPTTMTVELTNGDTSKAKVQVRNNSLQERNDGHLLATLVDANGNVLETKNVDNISLTAEQTQNKDVIFGTTGAKVLLSYGEPVADAGAAAKNITVDGLPLTIDSFELNDKDGKYYASVTEVPSGSYVLTVKPESSNAKVTVNGAAAENGIAQVAAGGKYEIVVANGADSATYVLTLERRRSGGGGGAATKVEDKVENPTETPAGDLPFDDVKAGDWFNDDVRYAWENGLMNGTTGRSFEPNSDITRGMIVTILYRLAGEPEVTATNPFKDVASGAYYEDAIVWAADQGVVTGYDAANFGPNDSITREQMAAILWRYAKAAGADVSVGEDTNILSYDDALAVSEYAMAAMQWACGAGVINGVTERTLEPQGKATRAQAAAILHRYCENVLGKAEAK